MNNTDLARAYAQHAADATKEGDCAQAEYYFNLALAEDPDYAPAYSDLAALYGVQGRMQESLWAAQEALRRDPSNTLYLYNVGTGYMETGRLEQAIAYLRRAVSLAPTYSLAVFNLAMCFDRLGQLDEAVRWFQRAADLDPSDPDPVYNIAEIHFRKGAFPQAEKLCDEALELFEAKLRSTEVAPWLPEGEPLSREGLLADLARRKAAALALMGWIQANQRKLKPALESLQKATSLHPYNAGWFMLMAEIYTKLEKHAEARQAWAEAQQLDELGAAF